VGDDTDTEADVESAVRDLFAAVIADQLASIRQHQLDPLRQDIPFSSEGRRSFDDLKSMFNRNPDLKFNFLDSDDWCNDDADRSLHLHVGIQQYVTFAVNRQAALGRLELGDGDFDEIWDEVTAYVLRQTLDWNFIAPLKNFVLLDLESVHISPWLQVRPLIDMEVRETREERLAQFEPSPRYGIEVRILGEPRRRHLAPVAAKPPLELVLGSLRLHKPKGVWITSVTAKSNSPLDSDGLTWSPFEWAGHRVDPYGSSGDPYALEHKESEGFLRTLRALWAIYWRSNEIQRSLSLFNEAFEQSMLITSFLRIWGAIEAAFVSRGSRRIAETAASILSELVTPAGGSRDEVKAGLRESYRLRSEIVHGGSQATDMDIMSTCAFTTDCYRRAMLARVEMLSSSD
jgi:hypothetical protein